MFVVTPPAHPHPHPSSLCQRVNWPNWTGLVLNTNIYLDTRITNKYLKGFSWRYAYFTRF